MFRAAAVLSNGDIIMQHAPESVSLGLGICD